MEEPVKSKRKIIPVIIIVLAVIVISVVVYILFIKPEEVSNPIPVIFENYDSILYGSVQDYVATLNNDGHITIDLASSEYLLYYTLEECTNPSENLDYTYTSLSGEEISYDPLKEKIIETDGEVEKQTLSEAEQDNALITEKIYVIETEGTETDDEIAISKAGTTTFNADGNVKFSFESKCDDASITLKLYKI